MGEDKAPLGGFVVGCFQTNKRGNVENRALKRKGKKLKTPPTHLKKIKINTSPPWQLSITGKGGIFLACSISCVRLPTGSFWICERERMLCTKGTELPGWKSDGGGPKRGKKESGIIKDTQTSCAEQRGLEHLSI